jgi:transcriptional regulator with XRE-family HTH domain
MLRVEDRRMLGARLRSAMQAKGLTSDRNRSGVDVAALARGIDVSYEMARRYAEGQALTRPDVMDRMAEWLGVDSASLAWGASLSGSVSLPTLEQCLRAVQAAEKASGVALSPERAARIVAQLYDEAARGEMPSAPTLAALLRAMKE